MKLGHNTKKHDDAQHVTMSLTHSIVMTYWTMSCPHSIMQSLVWLVIRNDLVEGPQRQDPGVITKREHETVSVVTERDDSDVQE